MGEWALEEPGSPSMVPRVRAWTREVLADFPDDLRDRAELIASEYVTNAIRHSRAAAGDLVRIHVEADDVRVRLEIRDGGPRDEGSDVWTEEEAADFGRGLEIVEALADAMGDETGPAGRLAWAEVKT